jgi:signal transduction histidine kinase
MRRGAPEILVATLILLLLGSYVWYTQGVVHDLRDEAERSSRLYARVWRAMADTSEGASNKALFDLVQTIRRSGVPVIVTDSAGRVTAHANLPFEAPDDDPRVAAYVHQLDRENVPVVDPVTGTIHFGNTSLVRGLNIIPTLQALTAVVLLFAGLYIIRTRGNAARERVMAGMARESAHQLGTPLSSLAGWIELLEERGEEDPSIRSVASHMRADLDRLDRVAHRFERIGREPRLEAVNVDTLVDRVAGYFKARVPTLATRVEIDVTHDGGRHEVHGDPVLIEWALEVLAKNAIDALAGRGGRVKLSTASASHRAVRVRVEDNGPGIPRELRSRIFEPGFSTKESGWGIGLSLAKRIVEENHGGKLVLQPSDEGAIFDIILR